MSTEKSTHPFPVISHILSQTNPSTSSHHPPLNPTELQILTSQFPHIQNPTILTTLSHSIPTTAAHTLTCILTHPDPRPAPDTLAAAKLKLSAIQDGTAMSLGGEDEKLKSVVRLSEMYEELGEVEKEVLRGYEELVKEIEGSGDGVCEEIVELLKCGEEVEKVVLCEKELRSLPDEIGKLSGVVLLNVSRNHLEAIPDSLAGLQKLQILDVSSNLLRSLPDSVGLLTNLRVLKVSGNKLTALPESITRCSSLVELDASFNNLRSLPENFGYGLGNLERLLIQLNKLLYLPPSVCEMKSLKYLDAQFNQLHGLPHAFGGLTNLEVLNLSSNFSDLTELPDTLGDLINLRELELSNNQIRALPDTFHRLVNLKRINLDLNPLKIPPAEVVKEGVESVKDYMARKWDDMIAEEQKRILEFNNQKAQGGWLTWGTSLVNNVVSGVSQSVSGYLGAGKVTKEDPWLDQQL